jgi:hypothetical protein
MNRTPRVGLLLVLAAASILSLASTAQAVPIHHHVYAEKRTVEGVILKIPLGTVVYDVAPRDRDDDGCANADDTYNGPGCSAPEPTASLALSSVVASAPAPTTVAPAAGAYSIPSGIVQCESGGDYSAVGPGTTDAPYGAYQIKPSTASSYGCDLSTPEGQDACAAEIWAAEGSSPWACA